MDSRMYASSPRALRPLAKLSLNRRGLPPSAKERRSSYSRKRGNATRDVLLLASLLAAFGCKWDQSALANVRAWGPSTSGLDKNVHDPRSVSGKCPTHEIKGS